MTLFLLLLRENLLGHSGTKGNIICSVGFFVLHYPEHNENRVDNEILLIFLAFLLILRYTVHGIAVLIYGLPSAWTGISTMAFLAAKFDPPKREVRAVSSSDVLYQYDNFL